MADEPAVLERLEDGVLELTLNRESYRNALSPEIFDGLIPAIERSYDDPDVRVVVIAARGRIFCAGAKLDALAETQHAITARKFLARGHRLLHALLECPKPTIARVQGHALAGGAGVATACDFVICGGEQVQLGFPEIEVAVAPALVMQILLRRVPWRIGMEWAMRGNRIPAAEAARWGLVSRVVEPDRLDAEVAELARELASREPSVMSLIKELGVVGPDMGLERAMRYAREMSAIASSAPAAHAAIEQFFAPRADRA